VRIGDESTYDVVYDDVAAGSPRIGRLTIGPLVVTIGPPYRRRSPRARDPGAPDSAKLTNLTNSTT